MEKRTIFGSFGFGRRKASGSKTTPQGKSSVEHAAGYLASREKNPKLANRKMRFKAFSEMFINTPVISASVAIFLQVIKKTEWQVTALEGNADSERYKEAIEEVMKKIECGWPQFTQTTAAHIYWGFSIQEWVLKRHEGSGVIGFKDIYPRSQHTIDRWDIDDHGEIKGVGQEDVNGGEELYIERRRMVYAVDNSMTDSPEGLGIFRKLYTTWRRLEDYLILEEIGFDTDLRGVPVAKVPLEELNLMVEENVISAERREEILDLYRGFLKNHNKKKSQGIMYDSEMYSDRDGKVSGHPKYEIDLLKGDGSSVHADLQNAIKRERQNMVLVLSTSFILLGEDGAGSLSLSETKIDSFLFLVTSTLQYMAFVYERDIFKTLAELNGWDEDSLPEMKFEEPTTQDILELTDALRNLSTAFGPLPQEAGTLNEVLAMMGLQPIDDEFIVPFDPDLAAGVMPGQREAAELMVQEGKGGPGDDPEDDDKKKPKPKKGKKKTPDKGDE